MIGLGISIPKIAVNSEGGSLASLISSLFKNNEQGVWYDPSDMSTMFQDPAGTTPVTGVEQPVGLILDKSRGLVLGPELVTNGDFSQGTTGWSVSGTGAQISVAGGVATVANGSANEASLLLPALTAGKWYFLSADISAVNGTSSIYFVPPSGSQISNIPKTTAGKLQGYFYSGTTGTGSRIAVGNATAGAYFSIDNISVRELPGNHATQTTSTSRPVLSARFNLFTKTEQFDDAVWRKVGATITPNAELSPIGTQTADSMLTTGANGFYTIASGLVSGVTYTMSVYAKTLTLAGTIPLLLFGPDANPANGATTFNLQTATVSTPGSATIANSITAVGNGWCLCKVTFVATATTTTPVFYLFANGDRAAFWGASLVPANQAALPYQRVNTSTDYDTAGFPLYLRFDGVDDFLVTNSINFTATDKMTVFAGVRKLSDAATGIVAELSVNSTGGANAGAFNLRAPEGAAATYSAWSAGTIPVQAVSSATYPAPDTKVLTMVGAIGDDVAALRANGAQIASTNFNQGTGNYGNYPLYIGRRGGTTLPANMNLYSLIVRGVQSTAQQIANAEKYVAIKTGFSKPTIIGLPTIGL